MATNPQQINASDPTVARQQQRLTDAALARVTSPNTVASPTASTPALGGAVRSTAPVIVGDDTILPQTTAAVAVGAGTSTVTLTTSANNESGDVTTVYSTKGSITVNPVNQTINQYTSVDSGVSQIVAGNGVTITSTGENGTGVVTINASTAALGNIVSVNLDGSSSNVLYGNGVFAPGGGGGNPFDQDLNTTDNVQFANITSTDAIRFSNSGNIVGALGYAPTHIGIESYGSNSVYITTNDFNTWAFNSDGTLSFPGNVAGSAGNVLIDSADDNFEVRGAESVNFEANAVVNIYTDTSNSAYQWQFGDDGNLTLPGNSSSINYANGSPYGGGSGYNIQYEIGDFVANTTIADTGEIQFCDIDGDPTTPALANKMFIAAGSTNEQSLGGDFLQWANNSYRGTISINDGTDQLTMNISDGVVYRTPEEYRGFYAGLNQIWGDDCSINQLIITNSAPVQFYNTDFNVEDDVFHATNLGPGNVHVMLNVYGSSEFEPINPQYLWNLFTSFVNNVLYDGATLRTDTNDIRTQFYLNTGNFRGEVPPQDYYQWFDFANGTEYFNSASTTGGSGTGATVRVRVNADNTYTVLGTANPGTGYIGGETLTVAGTDLGGASPDNDLIVFIDSVDGDGVITQVSYSSGTGVYSWPSDNISDGSDDQYDSGNYINTDLGTDISYANGIAQTSVAAFGGGDYCVMYNESIFCMVATNANIGELFYSGNLGSDGDGWVRWTGLVNFNDPVSPGNAPEYAYFNCEFLDGDLSVASGNVYNVTLDSAGINLDGYYAYFNNNNNDYYFGSNNTFRLESQEQLFVQSYDTMYIQTMTPQRGPGLSGPNIIIEPADGCDAVAETNTPAQQGGSLYLRGGDGGVTDGVNSLGASGGFVDIVGGLGTGNAQAGNVNIYGGEGAVAGSINLYTDFGSNSSGKVKINTYDGNTNQIWEFRPDGSTIFPTLTVDIHNGGNQQAQTLQFGDGTQQVIITGPTPTVDNNAQRLIIQGQRGNGTGEGGDVYFWGGDADTNGGDIKIYAGDADNVSTGSGGYVNIEGGSGFDFGGYVSMQGGQSSNGQGAPASVIGGYGQSGGFANIVGGQGYAGPGGAVNITGGSSGNGLAEYGNVNIGAGASIWTFDNTGNLVLPNNTFSVNYANGTQVPLGGGGNTGNVTFDDITIQGVNQLNLSYDPLATANLAYLQVRGGDVASHIHLDTGNNSAYDLFVGNDDKYVQVSSTGNIIMSSYDGNTSYIMTLDNTGDLILAGGSSIIRSVANSSLDPVNPNVSTMTFIPDAGYTSQSLVLDPTAPGHIHLRAPSANIDEPLANIFLGGEDSSFEVGYYNGSAPNVFIHSGGNTWEFLNDGNLVLPRDAVGNTDPFLRITGGASPRILSEDVSLAGPANLEITALNTIFTGSSGSAIKIYADDGEIGSTANLQLWTNSGGNTEYSWTFGDDGNLTTSSNLVISPSGLGTGTAIAQTDAPLQIASTDANGSASIGWYENPTGPGNVVQVGLNDTTPGSMTVVTGDYANTTYVWDFDNAGDLTLPTGGELNATGKIGYTSGGTATQSGTGQGVTLNELTGQITLFKSSWNAGDTEVFNISCNKIANADYVMAQVINGSEASYFNTVAYPFTAVANSIRVQVTAVVASTATPVVQFFIMKAATS